MAFSANEFIQVGEQASVAQPPTASGRFYFKDDGKPYAQGDDGVEKELGVGGSMSWSTPINSNITADASGIYSLSTANMPLASGYFDYVYASGIYIDGTLIEGDGLIKEINQVTHSFTVGDVVRHNGTSYVKAQADSAANAETVGIVKYVEDSDNFTIQSAGYIDVLSGLTPGSVYFLDDDTAGLLTLTEPSDVGDVSKPMLISVSSTAGFILEYRGVVVAGESTSAGITGEIKIWSTDTAPDGYLLCYGQAVSRTTYAALFAVVGTTFGAGDTTTTFNVPDMRGRMPLGQDNMGGASADRVTEVEADSVGGAEGDEDGVGRHTHTTNAIQFSTGALAIIAGGGGSSLPFATIDYEGTTSGNLSPYLTITYIIKT